MVLAVESKLIYGFEISIPLWGDEYCCMYSIVASRGDKKKYVSRTSYIIYRYIFIRERIKYCKDIFHMKLSDS